MYNNYLLIYCRSFSINILEVYRNSSVSSLLLDQTKSEITALTNTIVLSTIYRERRCNYISHKLTSTMKDVIESIHLMGYLIMTVTFDH